MMFENQCGLHCVHVKHTASPEKSACQSANCVNLVHKVEVVSLRWGGGLIYTTCPDIRQQIPYHIILPGLLADNGPK